MTPWNHLLHKVEMVSGHFRAVLVAEAVILAILVVLSTNGQGQSNLGKTEEFSLDSIVSGQK